MSPAVPWSAAAVWAFGDLLHADTVLGTLTCVAGVLVFLTFAVQGWWADLTAYQPEGRHRGAGR